MWILCFGLFGILSTELGMMGIIPIVAQKFSVSIDDVGWSVSVFSLVVVFCAPIAPLLGMICLYVLIFVFAKQGVVLLIFAVLLGILAGVVNNATHYVITHPYPQAPDFANGLFVSSANIGLSTGVALCGLCISLLNTQYTALCAIVLLSMGVANAI